MKRLQTIASLAAAGALLVVPAVGQADHGVPHGKAKGHGKAKPRSKCVVNKGFVVRGTLPAVPAGGTLPAGYVADNPPTPVNEAEVRVTVTGANRHARRAGVDVGDPYTADGTPVTPATADNDDAFSVRLVDYELNEAPGAGDRVRIIGKVAVTKRKCEPNASLENRYGDVNVRTVKIVDAD